MKCVAYFLAIAFLPGLLEAQDASRNLKTDQKSKSSDSTIVHKMGSVKHNVVSSGNDRNVDLNAESLSKPRDINIGLPATTDGTSAIENSLPTVFDFWPEYTVNTWRNDNSMHQDGLFQLDDATIYNGTLGYSLKVSDKMGTDKFNGDVNLITNHFGFFRGTFNFRGPLKNKWYYTVSGHMNYDPGSYDLGFARWSDKTQIFKVGLTKRFLGGEINVLYRYTHSMSMTTGYAPFIFYSNGSVKALPNFRIGRDSYLPIDGTIHVQDILSGDYKTLSLSHDAYNTSHTVDIFGHNVLSKKWNFSYALRYHNTNISYPRITPQSVVSATSSSTTRYRYLDNDSLYTGNVQIAFARQQECPSAQTALSRFELQGDLKNHKIVIGLNEWYFNVDKYRLSTSFYLQETAAQPRKLAKEVFSGGQWTKATDAYGSYDYDKSAEYYSGWENKLAGYFVDNWQMTHRLSVKYGFRLEWQRMSGNYIPVKRAAGTTFKDVTPTDFENGWLNKMGIVNIVYNLSKSTGITAEAIYSETHGDLESYRSSTTPTLKKVFVPMAQMGVFYNASWINLISYLTYIKHTNYQDNPTVYEAGTTNTSNPTVYYDIRTVGWTTDAILKPFDRFSLHFLFTYQDPIYSKYAFSVKWTDQQETTNYDYAGKYVNTISKVLMEFDPKYVISSKLQGWLSFRYYSKQFANLSNALYYKGHWETFGGINYAASKNIQIAFSVINLLNQKGCKGTIRGAELITDASAYNGSVLAGSYIIPFTAQLSLQIHL